MRGLFLIIISGTLFSIEAFAQETQEMCMYQDKGVIKQASSLKDIPEALRASAKCVHVAKRTSKVQEEAPPRKVQAKVQTQENSLTQAIQSMFMAQPGEIELEGNVRKEKIDSSIGVIELRWPRKVESLFGRTPLRATQDAARTVSKIVRSSAFPTELQQITLPWQIVFLDENLPTEQIPNMLISNCHPGWMTPPANIYLVAQRIVAGCGDKKEVSASVADSLLAEVMIHEMGHALEFHLLKNSFSGDRMRAEGFATWFEIYAAGNSSVMSQSEIRDRTYALARASRKQQGKLTSFQGTPFDYAHASMFFSSLSDRYGLKGIMDVYQRMRTQRSNFFKASQDQYGWDRERFEQEITRLLDK